MPKKSKTPAPITTDQTVSEAFQAILRHNYDYLVQWEQVARDWQHIEGVHQVRVSFRRIRSAFSAFREAVPKDASAYWSEQTRWLASELGPARDLDVFIDEGLGPIRGLLPLPGEDRMMALAEEHRAEAYNRVRAMLDSDRYAEFRRDFPNWVDTAPWEQAELKKKQAKRLHSAVLPFSRKLLDRLERQVLESGSNVDKYAPEQMHQLRIECKKLRYGAEFFMPIIPGLDQFIRHMKGLQDLLGVMNDVAVMKGLLQDLLKGGVDAEVAQYAGGLVGWRTRQFHELLDSFDDRWDEFTQAKHPWWNKSNKKSESEA